MLIRGSGSVIAIAVVLIIYTFQPAYCSSNEDKYEFEFGAYTGTYHPYEGLFTRHHDIVKITHEAGTAGGTEIRFRKKFGGQLSLMFYSQNGEINTREYIYRTDVVRIKIIAINPSLIYCLESDKPGYFTFGLGPSIYYVNEEVNIRLEHYKINSTADGITFGGHVFFDVAIPIKWNIKIFAGAGFSYSKFKERDVGGFVTKFGLRY